MFGFGPFGAAPFGGLPDELVHGISNSAKIAPLIISSLIIPESRSAEGVLVRSQAAIWTEIIQQLSTDWSKARELTPSQWEELVAGAFKKALYDEVVLTPRSGDHGRDVIAIKRGIGSVKVIGSVKAYSPGHLVGYDDVRALLGVMSGERNVSKGMVMTTSDFPPLIEKDPFIEPFVPTRLELVNGKQLQKWLIELNQSL
jgi:restriction system protein